MSENTTLNIEQLKNKQLEMLKIFIGICKKYNLRYYAVGGTCLGAVRHNGFIPWDDDIDVAMPKCDYNKFLSVAQFELPDGFFMQTHTTDKQYPMYFGKLRNSNTTYIETSVKSLKINHGVYIDIFPLDGFPQNKFLQKIQLTKKIFYDIKISKIFYNENKKSEFALKSLLKKLIMASSLDLDKTIKHRNNLFNKYDYNSSYLIANYAGAWGEKEIMPRHFFGNGTKLMFENIEIVVPEDYHNYLSALYGDYMTPPPVEKRVGHHYFEICDLEKSYKYYTNEV